MIKRILVGLGANSYSETAVKRAIDIAKPHEAEILAVTVFNEDRLRNVGPVPAGAGDQAKNIRQNRIKIVNEGIRKSIALFESQCKEAKIPYNIIQEEGDEFDAIINHSRYFDLTVLGLQGLFDYGLLDDPENQVLRVFQEGVRPIYAVSDQFISIDNILIAYSGSMESAKAMKRFIQMRLWPNAKLNIVCFNKNAREADRLLSDAKAYCQAHGFEANVFSRETPPQESLLPFAKELNTDLIVLGDSSKSLVSQKMFGSTTLNAIKQADCPLFLTH